MPNQTKATLLANTGNQIIRNEIDSLRLESERLAVAYVGNNFSQTSPQIYPVNTFTKFVCNQAVFAQEVLLTGQVTPWNTTTSVLQNIQPNGFYVIRIGYDAKDPSGDRETGGRIKDNVSGIPVIGFPTLEDWIANAWHTQAQTIYFTGPANAVGRTYNLEFCRFSSLLQMGGRSLTIGRLT